MAFEWRFNTPSVPVPMQNANTVQGQPVQPQFVPQQPQQQPQPVYTPFAGANAIRDDALLRDEYRRNEAEIQAIQAELAQMDRQYSANEGQRLDQLDMQLAANRAGIGDIGNAIAHQNRIITRRQIAAGASGDYNTMKEKDAAASEIDNLLIMKAGADPSQQAAYDRAIERKKALYKERFKEDYGADLALPGGTLKENEQPQSNVDYDQLLSDAKKAAKDGYLTQAQIDSFRKKLEAMPKTAERQQRLDALNKEVSLEKHQKAVAENRKKEIAAIDEAILEAPTWKLKNGESATYAAKNGKQVTITRNNGKIRYAIGKTYKEK